MHADTNDALPTLCAVTTDAFATTAGFCASSSKTGADGAFCSASPRKDATRDFAFARSCARSMETGDAGDDAETAAGMVKP